MSAINRSTDSQTVLRTNGNNSLRRGLSATENSTDSNTYSKCCGKRQVSYFTILSTETLERIAFYSVSSNLVLFLNTYPYRWESYNAASASFFFLGISFVSAIFSGWLADSFLGKFKTIIVGFLVYLCSYAFLLLLAPHNASKLRFFPKICKSNQVNSSGNDSWFMDVLNDDDDSTLLFGEKCSSIVFVVLSCLAIGVGSVKTNITPFGGDQTRMATNESRRRFFSWFYWCTNVGVFVALGPIAYVQQSIGFFEGYLISSCCLCLAFIVFLSGCTCYVKKPSGGSTLSNVVKVIVAAIRSRRIVSRGFTCLQGNAPKPSCLDYAKLKYGGRYRDYVVEDVKVLLKIACMFLAMIPYWLVYFQMETTFLIQGLHMRLGIEDSKKVQIVAVWLSLGDPVFLLFLIPVLDRLVYPYLDRHGYHFSMLKRIVVGMGFNLIAMVVAGGLETYRLDVFWPNSSDPLRNASVNQKIGNDTFQAANLSVFLQVPQYVLLGCGEAFTSIAGLEFAYSKAPKSMKSLIMGLFFFCSGAGSFLGIATMNMFQNVWFSGTDHGNINCRIPSVDDPTKVGFSCHMDYFFYALAGFQFLFLFVFISLVRVLNFQDEYELRRKIIQPEPRVSAHETYRTFDEPGFRRPT